MKRGVAPYRLLIWLSAACLGWLLVISVAVQLATALPALAAAAFIIRQRHPSTPAHEATPHPTTLPVVPARLSLRQAA